MAPDEMFRELGHESDDKIKEILDCYDYKPTLKNLVDKED